MRRRGAVRAGFAFDSAVQIGRRRILRLRLLWRLHVGLHVLHGEEMGVSCYSFR